MQWSPEQQRRAQDVIEAARTMREHPYTCEGCGPYGCVAYFQLECLLSSRVRAFDEASAPDLPPGSYQRISERMEAASGCHDERDDHPLEQEHRGPRMHHIVHDATTTASWVFIGFGLLAAAIIFVVIFS